MYSEEFELAKRLVLQAYNEIIKGKLRTATKKKDNSLVTSLDIATENYIIDGIKSKFQDDNFLTEEHYSKNNLDNRTWIIDPIDGTTNFSNNVPIWSIQLAFFDKKEIQFSIMYFPELNQFYSAKLNMGVYLNDKKLSFEMENSSKIGITQYIGNFKRNIEDIVDIFKLLVENCQSQRYDGCASFGFASILNGTAKNLVSYKLENPWDELPGDFMCKELKVCMVDCNNYKKGKLIVYTRSNDIKELFHTFNQNLK